MADQAKNGDGEARIVVVALLKGTGRGKNAVKPG